jgi:precorrin-6A/cobalt-precorrin-6A reductase
MILVLGGATEGRLISKRLQDSGCRVILSTATSHGGHLALEGGVEEVRSGALSREDLKKMILTGGVAGVVDATHPYAWQVSETAMEVCAELRLPYIRYERPAVQLPEHPLLVRAADYRQAASRAAGLGNSIFLAIGSRRLEYFCCAPELKGKKLVARVLPEGDILRRCHDLGLKANQIFAVQGPFSREANLWMFKHFRSEVVVTKESGETGGFYSKWEACRELGLPLVVVGRPVLRYPRVLARLEDITEVLAMLNR